MTEHLLEENIHDIRQFNRFYTKRIGLLNKGLLRTEFSLSQARVIFELAQQEQITSSEIVKKLGIDPSYLSRILSTFERENLIDKKKSDKDNRQWMLRLTAKGKDAFRELDDRAGEEIREMLQNMSSENQHRFMKAINTMEDVLGAKSSPALSYLIRPHRAGDIGWIVHRHGVIYSEEYGWDETFEALTAEILAKFIQSHNLKRERIWIAEQDGEIVGSVMIVDAGNQVAQLRLLLVEPKVRGKGIGRKLIEECIDFSRRNGYKKIKLWTQSNLLAARHLYLEYGFELVKDESHKSFGHELTAEFWELQLRE
ncbi:MAG: bifunctional helix-turn-helix transcriptional regulator/GNAT family N-acetyltransferase [Candidatus Thorarchaeota archaeon]